MKALEAANMLAAEDDTDSEDDEPATPAPPPPKATKTKGRGTRKGKVTAEGSRGEDEALKKRKPKSKPAPKVQSKQIVDEPKSSISGGGEHVTVQPNDAAAGNAAEKEGRAAAVSEPGTGEESKDISDTTGIPEAPSASNNGKGMADMNTTAQKEVESHAGMEKKSGESQCSTFTICAAY